MSGYYITTSGKIYRLANLAILLGAEIKHSFQQYFQTDWSNCLGVLAWGQKPSAKRAESYAKQHNLPILRLEDGFLRSVRLGHQEPPLSVVVDDLGIYYDASQPSRLENLITQRKLSSTEIARARALIGLWRKERVSKYNHARELSNLPGSDYILVVDQTFGDVSISYGLADVATFQNMLAAALAENPDCPILLKVHPDVVSGKKRGYFDLELLRNEPRIIVLSEEIHPVSLLEQAKAVYCVTSQLGFEALLWDKPVRTFGMPFYAGWGLTRDDLPAPLRRSKSSLENLVHAALIDYPRYLHLETGKQCQVEELVQWLGLQRRMRSRLPLFLYAEKFSFYKRPIVKRFCAGSQVVFKAPPIRSSTPYACIRWGNPPIFSEFPVFRLEDGFIRSVGLGADLTKPVSWVIDGQGIYYDATRPSSLETMLLNSQFDTELLQRAQLLQADLVKSALTKYNLTAAAWYRPAEAETVSVILVPGQVESDASLAFGSPVIKHNLELLQLVRRNNPNAYLIYKPHPDVVAGLRTAGSAERKATDWCDEIIIEADMAQLLTQVDAVHTLTSLTGFEALLRGKQVVCYGQPFYAGWGLTTDIYPPPRRNRRLSLAELVAGALILYPTYISRTTGTFTTPERVLHELKIWREMDQNSAKWGRNLLRYYLKLENWFKTSLKNLTGIVT